MKLLEPFVQVVLALGQFAQPAEDLAVLALLALALGLPRLLGTCRSLLLISVLVVGQLKLLELPLRGAAPGTAGPGCVAGSCA